MGLGISARLLHDISARLGTWRLGLGKRAHQFWPRNVGHDNQWNYGSLGSTSRQSLLVREVHPCVWFCNLYGSNICPMGGRVRNPAKILAGPIAWRRDCDTPSFFQL